VSVTKFSVFYGYPAELVAQWCGVSLGVAKGYKSGRHKPSRASVRLFVLHRDGRVLGKSWEGWIATDDAIADPAGNVTTKRQLSSYSFVLQFAAAMAARDPETQKEWYELLKRA
jgi:hypothetical protein